MRNTWIIILSSLFTVSSSVSDVSYNQPKFCSSAKWDPNPQIIANSTIVGSKHRAIFINRNNTIYTAHRASSSIQIWSNDSSHIIKIIYVNHSFDPHAIFVTKNQDIYVDNGKAEGRIEKWTSNDDSMVPVMNVNSSCFGIFVDINDTLYCSLHDENKVVKRSLNDNMNIVVTAAGSGIPGSNANQFRSPNGIFVDIDFDLYVADYLNNRIQLFHPGSSEGITVAGEKLTYVKVELRLPSGIALDAEKNLFIADEGHDRIIRCSSNSFQCLIGCSDETDFVSSQLSYPPTLSFDSYGNIFLIHYLGKNQIEKYLLLTNSCNETSSTIAPIQTEPLTMITQETTTSTASFSQPVVYSSHLSKFTTIFMILRYNYDRTRN